MKTFITAYDNGKYNNNDLSGLFSIYLDLNVGYKEEKFSIKEEDVGTRLDVMLAKLIPDLTRSNLKKTIEFEQVKINNTIEKSPSKKLKTNDIIEINLILNEEIKIVATKIKLDNASTNLTYELFKSFITNKKVYSRTEITKILRNSNV
jgi:23S rRNA-/tRNA-specific pseudouridylate synthase